MGEQSKKEKNIVQIAQKMVETKKKGNKIGQSKKKKT